MRLRKGDAAAHPVDRVFGRLTLGVPVDALLDAMRGPRPTALSRPGRARDALADGEDGGRLIRASLPPAGWRLAPQATFLPVPPAIAARYPLY